MDFNTPSLTSFHSLSVIIILIWNVYRTIGFALRTDAPKWKRLRNVSMIVHIVSGTICTCIFLPFVSYYIIYQMEIPTSIHIMGNLCVLVNVYSATGLVHHLKQPVVHRIFTDAILIFSLMGLFGVAITLIVNSYMVMGQSLSLVISIVCGYLIIRTIRLGNIFLSTPMVVFSPISDDSKYVNVTREDVNVVPVDVPKYVYYIGGYGITIVSSFFLLIVALVYGFSRSSQSTNESCDLATRLLNDNILFTNLSVLIAMFDVTNVVRNRETNTNILIISTCIALLGTFSTFSYCISNGIEIQYMLFSPLYC